MLVSWRKTGIVTSVQGHDMRENLVHRASMVGDVLYRDVGEKPQLRRRQRQTKKEGVIKQNQAIEP